MPVEVQACGRPVIGLAKGGLIETTLPDHTAVWFNEQTTAAISKAVIAFERMTFDSTALRDHALRFSKLRFQQAMQQYIQHALHETARANPAPD